MRKSIVPLYGRGKPQAMRQEPEATPDMFGVADELRHQTGAMHAHACRAFLNGERADPEISASEMGDMLAQAPYERRFGSAY